MDPTDNNEKAGRKAPKKGLGKGLGALFNDIESYDNSANDYFSCEIDIISPNRYQPRRFFSEAELAELCSSIREQGIIQPLLVRASDTGYELVAGERRLRAAKMAGLDRVPVVVKEISDIELLEFAIIENIQRQDFTPIEEADAYHRLITEFKLTQEEVSRKVGKSRPTVTNFLRLRQLSDPIKISINEGAITMGHARALLGLENPAKQDAAWQAILEKGLSVRETEALVKKLKVEAEAPKPKPPTVNPYFSDLSGTLSRQLGTKVSIIKKGKKGKISIEFYDEADLERLVQLLG